MRVARPQAPSPGAVGRPAASAPRSSARRRGKAAFGELEGRCSLRRAGPPLPSPALSWRFMVIKMPRALCSALLMVGAGPFRSRAKKPRSGRPAQVGRSPGSQVAQVGRKGPDWYLLDTERGVRGTAPSLLVSIRRWPSAARCFPRAARNEGPRPKQGGQPGRAGWELRREAESVRGPPALLPPPAFKALASRSFSGWCHRALSPSRGRESLTVSLTTRSAQRQASLRYNGNGKRTARLLQIPKALCQRVLVHGIRKSFDQRGCRL